MCPEGRQRPASMVYVPAQNGGPPRASTLEENLTSTSLKCWPADALSEALATLVCVAGLLKLVHGRCFVCVEKSLSYVRPDLQVKVPTCFQQEKQDVPVAAATLDIPRCSMTGPDGKDLQGRTERSYTSSALICRIRGRPALSEGTFLQMLRLWRASCKKATG